jgi:hypothetical protein
LAKEPQVPAQNSNNLTGRERALEKPGPGSHRVQPKEVIVQPLYGILKLALIGILGGMSGERWEEGRGG